MGKNRNKPIQNVVAVVGLLLVTLVGFFSYYEQSMMGFPDGRLTEYDRFYKAVLYPIFFGLNALFLAGFIVTLVKRKRSNLILLLYFVMLGLFYAVQYYFSISLDSGYMARV